MKFSSLEFGYKVYITDKKPFSISNQIMFGMDMDFMLGELHNELLLMAWDSTQRVIQRQFWSSYKSQIHYFATYPPNYYLTGNLEDIAPTTDFTCMRRHCSLCRTIILGIKICIDNLLKSPTFEFLISLIN